MNANHRELISIFLTMAIVGFSLFIVHRFLPSILWAAVIAVSTFPAYQYFAKLWRGKNNWAASLFTLLVSLLLILPISALISVLVKETHLFANYLIHLNADGENVPPWIHQLPWFKKEFIHWWEENIGRPGGIKTILSQWDLSITPVGYYLRQIGASLAHRSIQLGFTLLTLFFFYRDGVCFGKQIDAVGEYCLAERWDRFSKHLPQALRSIVNGTVVVGFGVGILLGLGYWALGLSAPVLAGFITGIAAMVPFAAPIIFVAVALIFLLQGSIWSSLIIILWGSLVIFVADHFIKPVLISGAIKMPFLLVLFGILGGVETLGLLGLFVGPMIMVLFVTLWQEAQSKK